jgi:hypothetical protein
MFKITNLHATVGDKPVLRGLALALVALAMSATSVSANAANTIELSLEVPKPFRGLWTEGGASCKKRDAIKHARISKNVFLHRKSRFEIVGVRTSSERDIAADVYLMEGGKRNRTDISMNMVDDWTMMANIGGVRMAFIRCSAKEPKLNDKLDRAIDRI